jgi:hypothetical protein
VPILRHLESLGFLTSVHRMGEYCEPHAAHPGGTEVKIARSDQLTAQGVYPAACELARTRGVDLED